MKSAYIYPFSSKDSNFGLYNPYIDDLIKSLSKYVTFKNYDKPSKKGIFDILWYITKIDYIFFNWIEKLPENKAGRIQTICLILLLPLLKLFRVKVVWTMHNKVSHRIEHVYWKKLIFKNMLKYSDVILTHSSEGITYGEEMIKGSGKKIHYFAHPIKGRILKLSTEKKYDILIWGTILPYKGIDKFLDYIYQNKLENNYRILIVGKIPEKDYEEKLETYKSDNIIINKQFIEDSLLQQLISQSKIILFTYSQTSILSSGVLMDSLGYGANIVGPNVGAFGDLEKEGIINTYSDFPDMFRVVEDQLNDNGKIIPQEKINQFFENNSWDRFAENVSNLLK